MAALCHLIVRRPNLEITTNSIQENSLLAGKNIGVVLVPWCAWKSVPATISDGADISKIPGWHLLQQMSSQRGSQSR